MVYSNPVKSFVVIFLLSFAKSDFSIYCDWLLTADTGSTPITYFESQESGGAPHLSPDDGSDLRSTVGCNSITMNQETRKLTAQFTSQAPDVAQFAIGFWVNFESTIGNDFFVFGSTSVISFRVSSSTEGELLLKAYTDATTTYPVNDLSVTVPLGNFYIDKWIFLVFHLNDDNAGHVDMKVLVPGHDKYTKSTTADIFYLPVSIFAFGNDIKAKFYEVIIVRDAEIMGADYLTATLFDGAGSVDYAIPCASGSCTDDQCTTDSKCLTKKQLCGTCSGGSCTGCSDPGLDPNTLCTTCNAGNTLKSGKCNFYLGCADANNCATCSTSSIICDSCPADYFLYKASASSTSCIACVDSCTNCDPGPNCYECAESIVQSGSTCEVKQVGYEISFDAPNIVIDFAYPLSTALTKNSFTATTSGGARIPTTTWTFIGCTAGSIQCRIGTDLQESDTPFTVVFDFDQA